MSWVKCGDHRINLDQVEAVEMGWSGIETGDDPDRVVVALASDGTFTLTLAEAAPLLAAIDAEIARQAPAPADVPPGQGDELTQARNTIHSLVAGLARMFATEEADSQLWADYNLALIAYGDGDANAAPESTP